MKTYKLNKMKRGWFVGNFSPTALKTKTCEVAYKFYKAGEKESWHYHKIAQEITLIASGKVKMAGKIFKEGDIILLKPKEGSSFEALEDSTTVVVKIPGAINDKYTE